jgi:hypothetical protein
MEVIDLKYGKGIPVSAENNPQLRLYGLGTYQHYSGLYHIHTMATTVVKPRLYVTSGELLSLEKLLTWVETEVKAKAKSACDGTGEFHTGEHCKFCLIKKLLPCKSRRKYETIAVRIYTTIRTAIG